MSDYEIREAKITDALCVAEVDEQVELEGLNRMLGSSDFTIRPLQEREIYWKEAIEFADPQVFVATQHGAIIGFVGCDRSSDEGTAPTTGEIFAIRVLLDNRGAGVGSALLDAATTWLTDEDCTDVSYWVSPLDAATLDFFINYGFEVDEGVTQTLNFGENSVERLRVSYLLA